MFYNGTSIAPLHFFDLERSKVNVNDAKIAKMPKSFLSVTRPQMTRFRPSTEDENVPIPRRICLLVRRTADFLVRSYLMRIYVVGI